MALVVPAGQRVLIADGYRDAADSLGLLLHLWGYEALIAHTGPDALELARQQRPPLALLELKLDGIDGFALAQLLRAERGAETTLVALTALTDTVHRRRARESGFELYLVKPVEPDRLHEVLARFASPG